VMPRIWGRPSGERNWGTPGLIAPAAENAAEGASMGCACTVFPGEGVGFVAGMAYVYRSADDCASYCGPRATKPCGRRLTPSRFGLRFR